MNIIETTAFLAAANAIDPRCEITDDTVKRWHALIGDLQAEDVRNALDAHYRVSNDRIMPADVRRLVNGAPDPGRLARQNRQIGVGRYVPKPRWFDELAAQSRAEAKARREAMQ